jgi:hypothetical protein
VGLKLTTLVVIGTYSIGSCNSNYHTFTTTTDQNNFLRGVLRAVVVSANC